MLETLSALHIPASAFGLALLVLASAATFALLYRPAGLHISATITIVGLLGCLVMQQVAITVGFTVVALLFVLRKTRFEHVSPRSFMIETAAVLSGLAVYQVARKLIIAPWSQAEDNAARVIDVEQKLGFFTESHTQDLLAPNRAMMEFFNHYYFYGFLALIAATLVWLYFEHRPHFEIFRNALGISALLAVITISIFPVAPPRMMPEAGVIDTFVLLGNPMEFANEFAAVPSLHVGWTALAGYMIGRTVGGRWGVVCGLVPGTLMALTVVATGNHYWFDALIGVSFTLVPALIMERTRETTRVPLPPAHPRTHPIAQESRDPP